MACLSKAYSKTDLGGHSKAKSTHAIWYGLSGNVINLSIYWAIKNTKILAFSLSNIALF